LGITLFLFFIPCNKIEFASAIATDKVDLLFYLAVKGKYRRIADAAFIRAREGLKETLNGS